VEFIALAVLATVAAFMALKFYAVPDFPTEAAAPQPWLASGPHRVLLRAPELLTAGTAWWLPCSLGIAALVVIPMIRKKCCSLHSHLRALQRQAANGIVTRFDAASWVDVAHSSWATVPAQRRCQSHYSTAQPHNSLQLRIFCVLQKLGRRFLHFLSQASGISAF